MFSVFVFRGLGIIVLFIPGSIMLLMMAAVKLFSNDTRPLEKIPWALPLAFVISGLVTFAIGWLLEQRQKRSQEMPADEAYLFEPNDVFMFVRFKYWGFIWLAVALFIYLRITNIIS